MRDDVVGAAGLGAAGLGAAGFGGPDAVGVLPGAHVSHDEVSDTPPHGAGRRPSGPPDVALLTRDPGLAELVSPTVAACGMGLHVVGTTAHPSWAGAAVALVDARWGPVARTTSAGVVLALDAFPEGRDDRAGGDDLAVRDGRAGRDDVWRAALSAGARDVLRLPREAPRLLACLQAVRDPDRGGCVLGVLGGRGGAGASVLAAELAVAAAGEGSDVLLCDADPLGGGADLLLEDTPDGGLRWDDLTSLTGPLRAGALRMAVPRARGGPGVLTFQPCGTRELPGRVLIEALEAGRRGHELVVVDLPRRVDPPAVTALGRLDMLLLLVPAEVRAVAAAAAVLDVVRPVVADLRLVVRSAAPGGLPAHAVADALAVPVAARWPSPRSLTTSLDRADPPGRAGRRPLARAARRLASGLLADDHPVVGARRASPWPSPARQEPA